MRLGKAVINRIKQIIKDKGLTQYQLSKITGISQSTLSTVLSGTTETLKLTTLYEICSGLNIEFSDFFNVDYLKLENIED